MILIMFFCFILISAYSEVHRPHSLKPSMKLYFYLLFFVEGCLIYHMILFSFCYRMVAPPRISSFISPINPCGSRRGIYIFHRSLVDMRKDKMTRSSINTPTSVILSFHPPLKMIMRGGFYYE